jgi:hypothetical protein
MQMKSSTSSVGRWNRTMRRKSSTNRDDFIEFTWPVFAEKLNDDEDAAMRVAGTLYDGLMGADDDGGDR